MRGGKAGKAGPLVGLAIVLAFVFSAPAQAGTVEFDGVVTFRAAPGESNDLVITESPAGVFTIVDSVPLTTDDCDQPDPFTAVCTFEFGIGVAAELGDLADAAVVLAFYIDRVEGGDGGDTITTFGGPGVADVRGGPGDDLLVDDGRRGQRLHGGAGDDTLVSRTRRTRMYGRRGNDLLDARQGARTVAVGGPDGDRLLGSSSSDELYGGPGDDTLHGKGRGDLLLGGPDDDTVVGGRGRDWIRGGRGDDRIVGGLQRDLAGGGRGDDILRMRDRGPDRVRGGPGFDRARVDRRLDGVFRVEMLL